MPRDTQLVSDRGVIWILVYLIPKTMFWDLYKQTSHNGLCGLAREILKFELWNPFKELSGSSAPRIKFLMLKWVREEVAAFQEQAGPVSVFIFC